METYLRTHQASPNALLEPPQCPECHEDWEEPKDQELRCEGLTPETAKMYATAFKTYKEWLYTSRIPVPQSWTRRRLSFNTPMIGMYKLGFAISDVEFQKAVLSLWVDIMFKENLFPGATAVNNVYATFPADSPVRWLFIEVFATNFNADWWEKNWKDYPKELVKDVLVKTQREENMLPEMPLQNLKEACCQLVEDAAKARATGGVLLEEDAEKLSLALAVR